MKNQYFGDKRDFIKYSLIVDVLDHHPKLSAFAFVPMLTKNDSTKQGNVRGYPRKPGNEGVYKFLKDPENKSIKCWRDFFRVKYPDRCYIIGDLDETPEQNPKAKYFEHHVRQDYFTTVTNWNIKTNALVLIDPDIGIQPKDKQYWRRIANNPERAEKYLLKNDIELLAKYVPNSALMIYQHLQNNRHRHEAQAKEKLQLLSGVFDEKVSSVRCDAVQYLFASKNTLLQQAINTTLQNSAPLNGMTFESASNP